MSEITMRRHELWSLDHATFLCGSEDAGRAACTAFNAAIGNGCWWDIDASEVHFGHASEGAGLDACDQLRRNVCQPAPVAA